MNINLQRFENIIRNSTNRLFAIVGPNTVGKSFSLNKLYESGDTHSLYIDEYGDYKCKQQKSKVRIVNGKYIYENRERGKIDTENEHDTINSSSQKIIECANSLLNYVNTKYDSSGSKKLKNIISILTSINLNYINTFYIDEPENYLDDKTIKLLKTLFQTIINNNKKIVLVTHSARLLEIMKIKIDDIFMIPKLFNDFINITYLEVDAQIEKISNEISNLTWTHQMKDADKLQIKMPNEFKKIFLDKLLKSQEFYRTLFYNEVVLMEGLTEKQILEESPQLITYSENAVFCGGKFSAPIYISVYKLYKKRIVCFFDSDNNRAGEPCNCINEYILSLNKDYDNISYYFLEDCIESTLDISVENVVNEIMGKECSKTFIDKFIKKYKPYLSLFKIRKEPTCINKLNDVFQKAHEYDDWLDS